MGEDDQSDTPLDSDAGGGGQVAPLDRGTLLEQGAMARAVCTAWGEELRKDLLAVLRGGMAVSALRRASQIAKKLEGFADPRSQANAGKLNVAIVRLANDLIGAAEKVEQTIINDNRTQIGNINVGLLCEQRKKDIDAWMAIIEGRDPGPALPPNPPEQGA